MSNKNYNFSKIEDFSENARRVRRNLVIFACATIILCASGSATKIHKVDILGASLEDISVLLAPGLFASGFTLYEICKYSNPCK